MRRVKLKVLWVGLSLLMACQTFQSGSVGSEGLGPIGEQALKARDQGLHDKAYGLFSSACLENDQMACTYLGTYEWERGRHEQAKQYYDRPCNQEGIYHACYGLGAVEFIQGNQIAARNYFKVACETEHMMTGISCYNFGAMALNAGQHQLAKDTFGRGCHFNSIESCTSAGIIEMDDGNTALAREYLQKACLGKNPMACENLADLPKLSH